MSSILITGTSGYLGYQLAKAMVKSHQIVGLSRRKANIEGVSVIQGNFTREEDLHKLDSFHFDRVLHLAAVTGGCSEEDGLKVNVTGTHGLLRYCIDRGCKKFVLASSIAAVGLQDPNFHPLQLPIPDEHPCLDRNGYGLSKYLMEEVVRYLSRQRTDLDVITIRLGAVIPNRKKPEPITAGPPREWALASMSRISTGDAVRCFTMAAQSAFKPGLRIMNAVADRVYARDTVPEILRSWYGNACNKLDLTPWERAGHQQDSVFSISRAKDEIGFVPLENVMNLPSEEGDC